MGFNKRRLEDQRRQLAEKEVAGRRATDAQVLEDAERLSGAVLSIMPAKCAVCELVRLSRISIADEMREEHRRRVLGN
jgi:hypothetical protein